MPPSEETLSFRKDVLSTPYSSNILIPISLKKTYPIKYPHIAPKTDPNVAINAIRNQLFGFAIVIGTIITSGGIGKMKLSMKEITAKKNLEFLFPASSIVLLKNFRNIFTFII